MKRFFILISLVTFYITTINAQVITENNVPIPVKNGFNSKFNKPTEISWQMENKTDYEALFKQNGISKSAVFSKNGKWVKTTQQIKASKLSEPVKYNLQITFPKAVYTKIVDEDSYAYVKRYYINLVFKQKRYYAVFSPNGQLLKSSLLK